MNLKELLTKEKLKEFALFAFTVLAVVAIYFLLRIAVFN